MAEERSDVSKQIMAEFIRIMDSRPAIDLAAPEARRVTHEVAQLFPDAFDAVKFLLALAEAITQGTLIRLANKMYGTSEAEFIPAPKGGGPAN